jgi:H+-transporting ATPase
MDVGREGKVSPRGLTREEAQTRLRQCFHNAVQVAKPPLLLAFAQKRWASTRPYWPEPAVTNDSKSDPGVRVMMITGDALPTARTVASRIGIGSRAVQPRALERETAAEVLQSDVFAGFYQEDKFQIIQALQRAGMVTGMTGEAENDAPVLKQAEVGIAVANATDGAKAAASLTLTNPALTDVLAAMKTSRPIHQRMHTYTLTLNKIIKTVEAALFFSVGVALTGSFVMECTDR